MDLDVRMKLYEDLEVDRRLMPLLPVLGRFDGRAFHTLCRNMERPFDPKFHRVMVGTTKFLVEETGALVGYTQSDEISLLWYSDEIKSQIYFDGRVMKMVSVTAALASVEFNRLFDMYFPFPPRRGGHVFDGRVWTVPDKTEAANAFLWREQDAVKNSINCAGQARFSHAALLGKDTKQIQEMLFQEYRLNWNDYPVEQKRGTWLRRRRVLRPYTAVEIESLPPKHDARSNPDLQVERWAVGTWDPGRFGSLKNRVDALFDEAVPLFDSPEDGGGFVE